MNHSAKSIRAFVGAKNFEVSRSFYKELGFKEVIISQNMSYIKVNNLLGFYLQDAYVQDWINNTMIFLEVDSVETYFRNLQKLELNKKFEDVKLIPIRYEDWGSECFLHDPAGNLWHFGEFKK